MNYSAIIERCKTSDRDAQMEFYAVFYKGVFNSAFRILGNREEAEEVMQEAILKVLTRGNLLCADQSRMEALLRRMAINASIDICRKRKVRFVEVGQVSGYDAEDDIVSDNAGDVTFEKVRAVISGMPRGYRTILTLKLLDGMEYCEMAEELDVTESAVRSQYSRARRKLCELLTPGREKY